MGKGDLTRKSNPTNPKERVGGGRVSITARSQSKACDFERFVPPGRPAASRLKFLTLSKSALNAARFLGRSVRGDVLR